MAEQVALPERVRKVFEEYGVIKRVAVPKLDLLDKAITDRKGRWELAKNADGLAIAKVTMQGRLFTATADESALALSQAFSDALLGTQPRQGGLFDEPAAPVAGRGVTSVTLTGPNSEVTLTRTRAEIGQSFADYLARNDVDGGPTPEEIAQTLRAAGIPVTFQGGVYVDPETGDIYDDERAEWVRREYDAITKLELATV